LLLINN